MKSDFHLWSLRLLILGGALSLSVRSRPALGLTGFGPHFFEQDLPHGQERWEIHPNVLTGASLWQDDVWNDYADGKVDLLEALHRAAHARLFNPHVKLRARPAGAFLANNDGFLDFDVYAGDVPVCGLQVRAKRLENGEPFVMGYLPTQFVGAPPPSSDWPAVDDAVSRFRQRLTEQGYAADSMRMVSARRCLYLTAGREALPVWELDVQANGYGFHGFADRYEALAVEERFFEGTRGLATIYVENPTTGSLKAVSLDNLATDNTLTNDVFTTLPLEKIRASAADHIFNANPTDDGFSEISSFANGNRQMDFFKSLGYSPTGDRILIVTHAKPNGTDNNALYQPASASDYHVPTIQIGDGDGSILQNLPLDADVVSHELGHHIVFQYLKSTQKESLTIHEALADFFAFTRAGDACLGESVCPSSAAGVADGGACWIAKKCLRTGDNTLKITDTAVPNSKATFEEYGHKRGQVISGMLWGLRSSSDISADDITKLTFKAVSYLLEKSGYRDFILALLAADANSFSGKYCLKIKAAAIARGFADGPYGLDDLPSIQCTGYLPKVGSASGDSGIASMGDSSSPIGAFGLCGVIGGKKSFSLGLLTLFLPLIFAACRSLRRKRTFLH